MPKKKRASRQKPENKGVTIINQQILDQSNKSKAHKRIVKKNYVTALLLSIFLGWLGIDRFYVNHIGLGILKLILTLIGGIGLVWWIIDIILFATKNIRYVEWD